MGNQSEKRKQLIDAGLCVRCRCSNDRIGAAQYCSDCTKKDTQYKLECRKQRRDTGICVDCASPSIDKWHCTSCSLRHDNWMKAKVEELKTQGLCTKNCGRPSSKTTYFCNVCSAKYTKLSNQYTTRKRKQDPEAALAHRIACSIRQFLKSRGRKHLRSSEYVGCSWAELKSHLEQTFPEGATWDNRHLWQIDHIIPISSFDSLNESHQKMCWHWTNLQVLWTRDNIAKSNSVLVNRTWVDETTGWVESNE